MQIMFTDLMTTLGVDLSKREGKDLTAHSPRDGAPLAQLAFDTPEQVQRKIDEAHQAFLQWRTVPAPVRGELVRLFGNVLREHKQALGQLVTLEAGKIASEGGGEVQEMIDICDFAVGLSRQLYGLTIASERPGHRMMETWHPLGVCGVISAFNFPVAVWAWNTSLALVCGDAVVWKPSEKTPLTAIACDALFGKALAEFEATHPGIAPAGLHQLVVGARAAGEVICTSPKVALVSATGSVRMGVEVAGVLAKRLGRSILELGGNNGMIVAPTADLDMVVRAVTFAAVGTAGQRCTTLRRLIVQRHIAEGLIARLEAAFASVTVGDPMQTSTLVGPLIDKTSFEHMQAALQQAVSEGGKVSGGERVSVLDAQDAYYVRPALVRMPAQTDVVKRETFAPILYVMLYDTFDEALAMHNDVPQGLSSAIFTNDVREAEQFMAADGSDCGIANVNIGTSGAEIGGAFGGEKETGGGRESGSDAWKGYMRRATNTINYSRSLPLAQGVKFDI